MASLYKQPKSKFWWVKFRDPKTNTIKRQSTRLLVADSGQTRKARAVCSDLTTTELSHASTSNLKHEEWDAWVMPFLEQRYQSKDNSRIRYISAWRVVRLFLTQHKIERPRQLTRAHGLSYSGWRTKAEHGKRAATAVTARFEMTLLGLVMSEAVIRGFALTNPFYRLHLPKPRSKVRPEFTEAQLDGIQAAIEHEPECHRDFLRVSFALGRYHGLRIRETWLNPTEAVQFLPPDAKHPKERGLIYLVQKGNKRSVKSLDLRLFEMFKEMHTKQATETYPKVGQPSGIWAKFLTKLRPKLNLPDNCSFHSLRVGVASRLARGNVSQRKAMIYLSHASSTIHEAYVRWSPEDVSECHDVL